MNARQVNPQERTAGCMGGPNMNRCVDMRARHPLIRRRRAGSSTLKWTSFRGMGHWVE